MFQAIAEGEISAHHLEHPVQYHTRTALRTAGPCTSLCHQPLCVGVTCACPTFIGCFVNVQFTELCILLERSLGSVMWRAVIPSRVFHGGTHTEPRISLHFRS
eukprot:m.481150 g.481150  ORF g.481150 m.481150 type:complete len:103 (+) comp55907_c0_seq1:3-311(+)